MNYRRAKLEGKWRQYGEKPPQPHHGLFYHQGYQYSTPSEYGDALPMGIPETITQEQYRKALQTVLVEEVREREQALEASKRAYRNILHTFDNAASKSPA